MKFLHGLQSLPELKLGTVAAIGNFDGVHLGHQALLARLREQSMRLNLPSLVILFEPQPCEFFRKEHAPSRLTRLREKLHILKKCQIDYVYCLSFDQRLALMPAEKFAQDIVFSRLYVKYLLVGHDFHFGHNRVGDVALLQKMSAQWSATVDVCPDFFTLNERVSSTRVRAVLREGQLKEAALLLGRNYSLCGRVVHGEKLGRQWGIPTANLNVHRYIIPLQGIFCVSVQRAGKPLLYGVANLGNRPTVDGHKNLLEIYIFDFNEQLYGEMIQVFFLHKLRDEVKFPTVDELISQIHLDVKEAQAYFST